MAKQLLVNADDFGLTPRVNEGIVKVMENGIVRSTSVMANMPSSEAIISIRNWEDISIGIHLNLTTGKPLSSVDEVPSLVNDYGNFWEHKVFVRKLFNKWINMQEVQKELDRQVERIHGLGVKPTHFDSHQNVHLYPSVFRIIMRNIKKWQLRKMRSHKHYLLFQRKTVAMKVATHYIRNPHQFVNHFFASMIMKYAHLKGVKTPDRLITPMATTGNSKYDLRTWLYLIRNLPEGTNEVFVHPGYVSEDIYKLTSYIKEREKEVKLLTSAELKTEFEENNIQLISFNNI